MAVFVTPGDSYRILAPSASLRKHLTDSYWCDAMEEVCDGKLEGVAVRYTGENLVMLQFRPKRISPAGYRYPLFMSIPIEFMVPEHNPSNLNGDVVPGGNGTAANNSCRSTSSSNDSPNRAHSTLDPMPKLCVVCGRYNLPGIHRHHGWKCKECKGQKSLPRLREKAHQLMKAMQEDL